MSGNGREWKPGDVALRTTASHISHGYQMVTVATPTCSMETHGRGLHWHHADGGWDPLDASGPTYRPLLVIDPEDREQVERLAGLIARDGKVDEPFTGAWPDKVQAALHSLLLPPKPDEPTGLGAVVEDTAGVPWVRCENADREPHWYGRNRARQYADLDVIRVLSDGVTTP